MKKQKSASLAVVRDSLTSTAELTNKTRAPKTRQSKANNQPSENMATASTEVNVALSKLYSPSAESTQPIDQITMQPMLPAPVSSVALTSVTAEDISAWREIAQEQQLTID